MEKLKVDLKIGLDVKKALEEAELREKIVDNIRECRKGSNSSKWPGYKPGFKRGGHFCQICHLPSGQATNQCPCTLRYWKEL